VRSGVIPEFTNSLQRAEVLVNIPPNILLLFVFDIILKQVEHESIGQNKEYSDIFL